MYAVVGCSECGSLWVLEGRPDRTECPTCGTTRGYEKRRKFATTDDPDEARELRARLLAERSDHGEAFESVDAFADLEERLDEAGVDDEEYLAGSGVDPDAVAAAGERAGEGTGGGQSRRETVLAALRDLDSPSEAAVVDYATDRGVPAEYVRSTLEKLVREGRVSEHRGTYRLL